MVNKWSEYKTRKNNIFNRNDWQNVKVKGKRSRKFKKRRLEMTKLLTQFVTMGMVKRE